MHCLPRVKLKVLGSSGVGKSLLIETLKCGLLGGFFRSRLSVTSTPHIVKSKPCGRCCVADANISSDRFQHVFFSLVLF